MKDEQRLEQLYQAQDEVEVVLKKYNVDLLWDYDGLSLEPCEGGFGIRWGDRREDKTPYRRCLEELHEELKKDLEKAKRGEAVWRRVPDKDPKSYRPEGLTVDDLQGYFDKVDKELSSEM